MSIIVSNQGPVSPETSIVPASDHATLIGILLELRVISLILKQGLNVADEDAALRNSMTVSDLTNLG